jgi:hypothetical protein
MAITEVTNESWFGRIGESIKGVLFGLLLLVVAGGVLFWNEGRAVREAQTIEEGLHNVVDADPAAVSPADEGKLVHLSGQAVTGETLADAVFGVSARRSSFAAPSRCTSGRSTRRIALRRSSAAARRR